MSHELRTPLNAIIGYSEMLQEEAEDLENEEFEEDLERINGTGKHLLGCWRRYSLGVNRTTGRGLIDSHFDSHTESLPRPSADNDGIPSRYLATKWTLTDTSGRPPTRLLIRVSRVGPPHGPRCMRATLAWMRGMWHWSRTYARVGFD